MGNADEAKPSCDNQTSQQTAESQHTAAAPGRALLVLQQNFCSPVREARPRCRRSLRCVHRWVCRARVRVACGLVARRTSGWSTEAAALATAAPGGRRRAARRSPCCWAVRLVAALVLCGTGRRGWQQVQSTGLQARRDAVDWPHHSSHCTTLSAAYSSVEAGARLSTCWACFAWDLPQPGLASLQQLAGDTCKLDGKLGGACSDVSLDGRLGAEGK